MADGSGLLVKLNARINAARRALFYPYLVRAVLPVLVWLTVFSVFWLSGLYGAMPVELQAATGVVFWTGFLVTSLVGWKVWRAPTDEEARSLIDDAIEGRPLAAWNDRPASLDMNGWTLWEEHRNRMAALTARIETFDVRAHWREADPLYIRLAAPGLIIGAALFANTTLLDRLSKGLFPDIGALFGAHTLKIEAWITPPAYTGSAPFVLTQGESARAPEGSEVTIRVIGPGQPQIKVMPAKGPAATLHPQSGVDAAYEARVVVKEPMRITVDFWGSRASYPFTIIDDAAPMIAFVEPPKLGDGDRTEFKYKLSDDYGVEKLELVFFGRKDVPASAGVVEDAVAIDTITLAPKEEEGAYSQDLVKHRWAGMDLKVKLRATDAAGQVAESKALDYRLPEKIFLQPNARMAQEARATLLRNWENYKIPDGADNFTSVAGRGYDAIAAAQASRLRWAPEGVKRSAMQLDAATWRPEDYFEDPVVFMGLRNARAIIETARDKTEAESAEGLLWDIALRAEYGSLADAAAALEAARRALEEALRRGAPEEEIKRLMDMYEQAIENYLAAQMADALRNGRVSQGDQQQGGQGGPQALGNDELNRMLQALRDLAETGARDQARQLLNDMQKMLDKMQNMQLQMGGGGSTQPQDGPMNRAMNRALQDTNRAMNDQRDLNDQTDEAQRQGDPRRGQQLADQQRQLRERLEQQMRSGGGQPQQQGQNGQAQQPGQQQGQGQQGPGQGQQQGQQGQGGQGNQPGQQPGQQQGPGQGQGQQADRGGPGGQPGRPGVQGDGVYGQETARTRQLLGNAIQMQKRAEEALRRGDFAAAREAQNEAMSALQDRSSELARLNDQNDPEARQERDERDILGRLSNGNSGFGDTVKIPEEMDRQKARDILNEIRRRAGNRALTKEELDYLNRLLERF